MLYPPNSCFASSWFLIIPMTCYHILSRPNNLAQAIWQAFEAYVYSFQTNAYIWDSCAYVHLTDQQTKLPFTTWTTWQYLPATAFPVAQGLLLTLVWFTCSMVDGYSPVQEQCLSSWAASSSISPGAIHQHVFSPFMEVRVWVSVKPSQFSCVSRFSDSSWCTS